MKRGEIAQSVSRGAFYLSIEKGAALVSGIVYFALLLRWLGPRSYGIMTLALSFVGLATTFTGNSEAYLERYAAEHLAHGQFQTLRRAHLVSVSIKLVLGTLAALALAALSGWLAHHFRTPELAELLPALGLVVALDGLATTGRAMLYGMQRFRWLSAVSLGFHVLKTAMVGTLWWLQEGLTALAVGLSALTVLQGLVTIALPLWMLRNAQDADASSAAQDARNSPTALLRAIVSYCLPLLGARATFLSGQNLGKILLGRLFPPAFLGYYSFAFQTVERFVELFYALPSSLLPSFTHLVARGERERLRRVYDQAQRLIQLVALALSATLVVFAREITLWVGSPQFEPAIPMLKIMGLVPIVRTAQQPMTMLFQALRRPGVVLGLALVKFATEFTCYFALVPLIGMPGAAWANLAGATASCAGAMLFVNRLEPQGAVGRGADALRAFATFLPLMALGLFFGRRLDPAWSLAARLALVPVGVSVVFAFGLVGREDLDRLTSFPLQARWMNRTRDAVMGVLNWLDRTLAPRRTP